MCDWREGKLQVRCGWTGNPSELSVFTIVYLVVINWFCILSYEGIHSDVAEGDNGGVLYRWGVL